MSADFTSGTWGSSNILYTTTTSTSAGTVTFPPATASHAPKPKVPTPLEWLADEVDRICALTRGGLAIP
jgi:hypothetical protein